MALCVGCKGTKAERSGSFASIRQEPILMSSCRWGRPESSTKGLLRGTQQGFKAEMMISYDHLMEVGSLFHVSL